MNKPKVGDIFRWSWNDEMQKQKTAKAKAGTLYWCCSRICIFREDEKFWDTYWSMLRTENKKFTLEEAATKLTLTYVANIHDLVEVRKDCRAYYEDKDFIDISHANSMCGGFYLRKDAVKSLDKMRRVMNRTITKLQYDADYAQRRADAIKKDLEDLTVESFLPTTKGIELSDFVYGEEPS